MTDQAESRMAADAICSAGSVDAPENLDDGFLTHVTPGSIGRPDILQICRQILGS